MGGDVLLFRRLPPLPHPADSLCETKTALPPRCFVLADQVFIDIAQHIHFGGELCQPFGDRLDDGAELGVAVGVGLAQLGGARSMPEKRSWKMF